MKKIKLTLIVLFLTNWQLFACPVCERNQPKLLKGIVHGSGPESNWDYVSIIITAIIAVVALVYCIVKLIRPNEKNRDHIKYFILK